MVNAEVVDVAATVGAVGSAVATAMEMIKILVVVVAGEAARHVRPGTTLSMTA